MTLFAASPNSPASGQIILAMVLAAAGFFLLLPRPRGRWVAGGVAALVAALAVFGAWLHQTFGGPTGDTKEIIGAVLFALFAAGAVGFGAVLVLQSNPGRGAMAFAFVILSTCGLFLLLAAPFLMAATIIVYAGAIVVTFLFVLMLSATDGPSDENDRSREPLLGSLAGFGFVGLVLFTLYQTQESVTPPGDVEAALPAAPLPAPVLTPQERATLNDVAAKLAEVESDEFATKSRRERAEFLTSIEQPLEDVVGVSADKPEGTIRDGSIHDRLAGVRNDPQAATVLKRAKDVRRLSYSALSKTEATVLDPAGADPEAARNEVTQLRDEVRLLAGEGLLPARNVANVGLVVYSEYLLAVELAGVLLLVATIGSVAIAQRRGT